MVVASLLFGDVVAVRSDSVAAESVGGGDPAKQDGSTALGEAPVVVLVRAGVDAGGSAWRGGEMRIHAELQAMGFRVVDVVDPRWPMFNVAGALGRRVQAHAAVAGVRLYRDGSKGHIELWVEARDGEGGRLQAVEYAGVDRAETAEDAALQTAERVHAGVLELPARRRMPSVRTEVGSARELRRPSSPSSRHEWSTRIGVMGLASPGGGLPPGLGAQLACAFYPRAGWGVDVDFSGAAALADVVGRAGTAQLGYTTLRVTVLARPWPRARVSPAVGVGPGAWIVIVSGRAEQDYASRTVWTLAALPSARARVDVRVTHTLRLHAGLGVGLSFPRIGVAVRAEEVAWTGWPLVDGGLAIEYRLR